MTNQKTQVSLIICIDELSFAIKKKKENSARGG